MPRPVTPPRPERPADSPRRGADASSAPVPAGGRTALVASAAVMLAGIGHIAFMHVMYDDAFISFRYAANLAHGLGLVYNPGVRVEGYSNFLWTILMSVVVLLGGRPEVCAPLLSAVIAVATLAGVMAFARRRGISPPLAGLLLAGSACWATWATGGLETALFGACVTFGTLGLMEAAADDDGTDAPRRRARALVWSAVAIGLGCLARPDGPLVAACGGAVLIVLAVRGRLGARAAVAWFAIVALFVIPHEAWRLAYYGRLLPHTAAVKPPGLARFAFGAQYLRDAVRDLHLWILAVPLGVAPVLRAPARGLRGVDLAILTAVIGPFALYLASTGGDFMPEFRFVAPLLPLLSIVAAATLQGVADRLGSEGRWTAAGVMALVTLAYLASNLRESWRQQSIWSEGELVSVGWAREEVHDWLRIGDLLRRVALPTDTLATSAAGAVPYRSGLVTIDLLGLNANDLGHYRRLPNNRPGHMLLLEERELDEHPPQILLAHPLVKPEAARLSVSLDLRPEWHDRVFSHYDLVGLTLLGTPVRFVACALRKDVTERIVKTGLIAKQAEGR